MATQAPVRRPEERRNLQAWYAGDLRPKLVEAVRAGRIEAAPALALDRQMSDLLDLRPDARQAA